MSHTGTITCLLQIVTLCSCEERMVDQRGTEVAPWFKHCSSSGWWKGISQDKAMLIGEEIKSLALAVLELYLSEGKKVSQSVEKCIKFKIS